MIQNGSPAIDLVYNIFTSTDKSLRDKEYNNLLQLYYNTLAKTVRLLGSNPDELFTFDDLQSELKRFGFYGLLFSPMMIRISQATSSDINNLEDMSDKTADGESGNGLLSGLSESGQLEFERRFNGVIEDVVKLGYYHKIDF